MPSFTASSTTRPFEFSPPSGPLKPTTSRDATAIEADPLTWLAALFPGTYSGGLAPYHAEFWDWVWAIEAEAPADPYVGVWPRGWAKSTNAEVACVAVGARSRRQYVLYVCETQAQADDHVQNVGTRLESSTVEDYYPDLGTRMVGKYGNPLAWRRNRLRTAAGFTIDAIGLDTAARGVKLGDARPDLIIVDDVDSETDSPNTIEKKISALTKKLLPARAPHACTLVVQNLVHRNGIVAQLVDGRADFLSNRHVSGPHPALEGFDYEWRDGKAIITAGVPTWPYMDVAKCQATINEIGLNAFKSECQHEVELSGQPRFSLEAIAVHRMNVREPLPARALPEWLQGHEGLRVYALPKPGTPYVAYTDPAEGKGRDYTASGIMEARSRKLVLVLEDNTRNPGVHAALMVQFCRQYNEPLWGVERAKGEEIFGVIGEEGYTRIYKHEDTPRTPQQIAAGALPNLRRGFPMTDHTKRGLIDKFATVLEAYDVEIPDARMLDQCSTYIVTERMTTEASAGSHDDLVILGSGLVRMSEQPGAQELHTVPSERPSTGTYRWGSQSVVGRR